MGWMLILDYIKTAGGKLQEYWKTFKNEAKFSPEEPKEWKELCLDALVTEETTMYAPAAYLYLQSYFPPNEKEEVRFDHVSYKLVINFIYLVALK